MMLINPFWYTYGYNCGLVGTENIVTSGLVMHLDSANSSSYSGSGIDWYDLTANNNDATLVNGVAYGTDNCGVLDFDGVNDYADTNSNIDLSGTNAVTIEVAFRTSTTSTDVFLEHSVNFNSNNSFSIYMGEGLVGRITLGDHSTGYNLTHTLNTYNDGNWHYLQCVIDRSQTSNPRNLIYVDGVLDTVQSTTYTSVHTNNFSSFPLYINSRAGSSVFFDGDTGIVKVYDRALNSTELTQNFNAIKDRYGL